MLQLSDFSAGWTQNGDITQASPLNGGTTIGYGDFENQPYSIQESLYSFSSETAAEQGTENALSETEGNFASGYAPMSFSGVKADQVFAYREPGVFVPVPGGGYDPPVPTDFIVVRDGTTVATFYDGGGDAQLEVAAARRATT